jgi:cobalt-zinc-cadmium resistance protein CzcA
MVVRGIFPVNIALDETARNARIARKILMSFPEVEVVASQIGRPDDGMDPSGAFEMQCFVPLKPPDQWPNAPGSKHPRSN